MLRPEHFLPDRQSPLKKGLGDGKLAFGLVQFREIVESRNDVRMLGSERLFRDGKRADIERFGEPEHAQGFVDKAEIDERDGKERVGWRQGFFLDG